MAEDKDGKGTEDSAAQAGQPDGSTLRAGHAALPAVESPPLSPADPEPELALERKLQPKPEPEVAAAAEAIAAEGPDRPASGDSVTARLQARSAFILTRLNSLPLPSWSRIRLRPLPDIQLKPRHRRRAALAITVVLAAAFGAVAGSLVGVGVPGTPSDVRTPPDTGSQAAIADLRREIAALKVQVEATRAAQEKLAQARSTRAPPSSDITGSIPPVPVATPFPPPRPAERIAATASRPRVVRGWTLRLARNGLFLVEGRGDIYQVVPGAPLPGLGPVQEIRRQDGRWAVVTPKGLIVSRRDRRYFE